MDDRADLQRRLERLEARLRDNETRLRNVLEVAKVGGWELDLIRDVAVWSSETREILGVGAEAPANPETVVARCVDDTDRAIVRDGLADIRAGGSRYALTYRVFAPDGSIRVVHSRAEVRRDDQGRATRLVGIVQDVTEQEQLRAQLVQSQRLETVGRLAAGLAHDLNNMLTIIQGSCDFLERAVGREAGPDLATIRSACERSAALTRGLLAFTRQQVLQPESLDVNEVIGSVRKMLARLVGPAVVLDLRTPRRLGHVTADREQLIQVLVNLAANARDAMGEGGRLTIETAVKRLPEDLGPGGGQHVLVTVSDTGTGMSPEVLARIFDPFFTTKGQAGTGLGLSTSFGVISQSGGHLRARSSPGLGSTFEVWLPITPRAADHGPLRPLPRREPTMARHTVLLVEDEPGISMLSSRVLERAGFAVHQATTGRRALDLARLEAFDLVVTDLRLPDLDGHVVGSEVRSLQPDVAVLYVSGFAGAHLSEVSGARDAFLAKPYTPDQLLAAIQQLLAQPIS